MSLKSVVMLLKKIRLIDLMLYVIFIAAVANGLEDSLCGKISKSCSQNEDCCEGCCFKNKCVSYSENCIKENNPCFLHECPPNTECYLQKVQCIQAPCPPIPACKPLDYDYD